MLAKLLSDRPSCAALFKANRARRRRGLASIVSSAVAKTFAMRFNAETMSRRWTAVRVMSAAALRYYVSEGDRCRSHEGFPRSRATGNGAEITPSG